MSQPPPPPHTTTPPTQTHDATISYIAGEDPSRLQLAAQYFGLTHTRTSKSKSNNHANNPNSIWSHVSAFFLCSDTTLEAARMHSVGVMAREERVAEDGSLHVMSMGRMRRSRIRCTEEYEDLMDIFQVRPVLLLVDDDDLKEDDDLEEVLVDTVEGGSITAAVFGIVKGMVGPAILYLPRGFAVSGYGVAISSMIVATITYLYSAMKLLEVWKVESMKNAAIAGKMEEIQKLLGNKDESNSPKYGSTAIAKRDRNFDPHMHDDSGVFLTYSELGRRAFGKGSVLISGGIAAMQFGVCLTYLIFVPQNLVQSTKALFGIDTSKNIFLAAMLLIEIPLVWIRDIRKLTPFNITASFLIAFGLLSVLFIAVFGTSDDSNFDVDENHVREDILEKLEDEFQHLPIIKPSWFLFIGTSFFCFEGSITLLVPLQEAVYSQEDRKRFPRVNLKVTSSIVAFYIFFGTVCWASFGDSVHTALTASLPESDLSTIVQIAYSIAVIFTFPLQVFPALEVVCSNTNSKVGSDDSEFKRNVVATFITLFLGLLALVAIDYLGNVVSLLGSVVGIPIALVYPPLIHNKLVQSNFVTRLLNYCLVVVGLFAAVAAAYTTITSWNEGAEGG